MVDRFDAAKQVFNYYEDIFKSLGYDEYAKMAEQYKMELDKIKEMVDVEAVKSDLKGRKAVKLIVDNAKPVEKEKEEKTKNAAKKEEAAEAPAEEAKTEE